MDTDRIPHPVDLPNKPLGEAIFELRWALNTTDHGLHHDPGFRILLGRYYDGLREHYPHIQDLPISQMPDDMAAYAVRHRFRPSENGWPLAQIGPGIMTVNDTESYTWREFRSRVSSAVKVLFESYPTDIKELIPVRAQLTYINAISFDQTKESMTRFLRDRLHISIAIEPQLFEDRSQAEKPTELNLNLAFPLDKPSGSGILRFSNGRKNEGSALVWQIVIRSADAQVPRDPSGLDIWLEDAHQVAETWFFTLVRGELLKTFETNDGNNNG